MGQGGEGFRRQSRLTLGAQSTVRGYNITYRYNGRDVTVRLPYDPGPNGRVAVSIVPEGRPPVSYNAPTY